jgi:hypothetical protein
MELTSLLPSLLSTQTPLLPAPGVARVYLSVGWALVLAGLSVMLLQRRVADRRVTQGLPLLLALVCLLPGVDSPAYWLGLAFRAPSLLSTLLCALVLLGHYRPQLAVSAGFDELRRWAPAFVLLGWVLLLDTLALSPFSLYALGFAPLALGAAVLLGLLPWLLRGAWRLSALIVTSCALYVILRLPSGNVWDALLDPWLWLVVQMGWLRRLLRRH